MQRVSPLVVVIILIIIAVLMIGMYHLYVAGQKSGFEPENNSATTPYAPGYPGGVNFTHLTKCKVCFTLFMYLIINLPSPILTVK